MKFYISFRLEQRRPSGRFFYQVAQGEKHMCHTKKDIRKYTAKEILRQIISKDIYAEVVIPEYLRGERSIKKEQELIRKNKIKKKALQEKY